MTGAALTAGLAVAGAVWLLIPRQLRVGARRRATSRLLILAVSVPLVMAVATAIGARAVALAVVVGLAALGGADLVRRDRRRRSADEMRQKVVEMGEALAGEVRAGRRPADALARVAAQYPLLAGPAEAARLGGDVPAALRSAAATAGAESLLPVAATWQLSQLAGAGLSEGLERATAQARGDLEISVLVAGELASARATARLLAVMPFMLLTLGRGMGFDPWGFLLRSWAGLACLAVGVVLSLVGLHWVERIGDQGAAT